ncbi:NnrU family protein [Lyngbya confervoides]|uniref:NnrU domain-containing protein n=1 Tax=Lyngbya confervoides BDU141951 TaxID=1574623 RepID=A0ABD4T5B8_9CYAN|nr:NnrU family protein [Lyngbya confervoides]MCM1983719.1 hypothetical protein [Lyngbya confervoides BDU141951]
MTGFGVDAPGWLAPSHFKMLALLVLFACIHSGLASLRVRAEKVLGARLYRVGFALLSIPMAALLIVYFIRHRYDGVQLWQIQPYPWVESLVWGLSALSFLFLYPATFNLLEVAAIQRPQVHLYETGIIRITRHPQMVGQVIWCVAHALWIGTTFTLATCLGLVGYHLFASWHGDRRLAARYGEAFTQVKARTSIVPFWAIVQGKQSLQWGEFLRPAYLGVALFVGLFWWIHPHLVAAASQANV